MPRKARIDYPGLSHHIMARTFAGMQLFRDDDDRQTFLSLLSSRVVESGAACYAWAMMETHYHLLLRTSEKPLWTLMKPLNTDYAHYYNAKYDRRGTLFSDRYKSIATQEQLYLERLVRYIHRNPLRAKVCANIAELNAYPWCGHSALMGTSHNEFQDLRTVLARFGKSQAEARKNYLSFIAGDDVDAGVEDMIRESNAGRRHRELPERWVLGDPEFQRAVLRKDRGNRLTITRYRKEGLSLDLLARKAAREFGLDEAQLKQPSKRTAQARARMAFCYWARQCGISSREIGGFLGIQQAAVSNAARKGQDVVNSDKLPDSIM